MVTTNDPKTQMLKTLVEQFELLPVADRPSEVTAERLSEFFGNAYANRNDDDRAAVRKDFWKQIQEWLA